MLRAHDDARCCFGLRTICDIHHTYNCDTYCSTVTHAWRLTTLALANRRRRIRFGHYSCAVHCACMVALRSEKARHRFAACAVARIFAQPRRDVREDGVNGKNLIKVAICRACGPSARHCQRPSGHAITFPSIRLT